MAKKKKKTASRRRTASTYEESSFSFRMPEIVRERPLDSFALFLAGTAAIAIVFNAMMLQDSRKPSRIARASVTMTTPVSRPANLATPADQSDDPSMLVREVQAELLRRGLYDGPTDGLFGPKTEAAIFDFEIGAGLKPTGRPNPQLLTAMRSNGTPSITPSPRVMAVQRVLDQQGFGPVKADGVLGEATRAAVRRFEASRGFPQKGEITPALLRELSQVSGTSLD
jgi:peptidoglycan hydrolase-like protein with peptidoglycan-binding domain